MLHDGSHMCPHTPRPQTLRVSNSKSGLYDFYKGGFVRGLQTGNSEEQRKTQGLKKMSVPVASIVSPFLVYRLLWLGSENEEARQPNKTRNPSPRLQVD